MARSVPVEPWFELCGWQFAMQIRKGLHGRPSEIPALIQRLVDWTAEAV